MFLFIISFLLIFSSSYFITSIIAPKKSILGLIYLFLIAFAQIVLTFEVLSLFSAIKPYWVLGLNTFFLAICGYLWATKSKPLWTLDCKDFKNRVNNALKLDKSLVWLYVGFCTFIITSLILCSIMPITNADAQAYHVARSLFWVLQGSLNHFDVADVRNLCLPINSEILYSWVLLFVKKDVFFGFFSFVGYLLSIISAYNILGYLGYCVRKRLWVIFILSSFSSLIVQVSGTETDIIIAGFVLSSIFLFWNSLKTNKIIPVFMAALAYALAIGTKTPSIMMIPGVGLFMLFLCAHYKKYKPLAWFLSFGLINFVIFSSYNYILNFIQFSNIMGSENFIVVSKNYYGLKGLLANFIKYIFMFFDFTGFRWSDYLGPHIQHLRILTLNFFHVGHVQDGVYTIPYTVNRILVEPVMGSGILGFLVFLPCLASALINPILKLKSRKIPQKTIFIFAFAIIFIINLLAISYSLAYMSFSVRFIMSFMVLSSPILVYSYLSKRNPLKYIIILFSLFYLIGVSTHLWARPLSKIGKILMLHPSITYLREVAICKDFSKNPEYNNSVCLLRNKITKDYDKTNRILIFFGTSSNLYLLKSLEFEGYKIDIRTLEDASKINFNNYNIIILPKTNQVATLIKDYEARKNDYKIVGNNIIISTKNLVPCFYTKNSTIPKSSESVPYLVSCSMTQKFIDQKHLEMLSVAGIIKSSVEDSDFFVIYRNRNLPLKLNKQSNKN